MKRRIVRNRIRRVDLTRAEVYGSIGRVRVEIESHLSPQARRAVAISFFRQLRSFLDYFSGADIHHSDSGSPDFRREEERGIFIPTGSDLDSKAGSLGFEIRMKRLEKGWNQSELAKEAGISYPHLSKIERGLCFPNRNTLHRLDQVLGGLPLRSWSGKNKKIKLAQGTHIPEKDPGY